MGKVKQNAKTGENKKKVAMVPVDHTAIVILSNGVYTVWSNGRRISSGTTYERAVFLASKRGYTVEKAV